MSLSGGAFSFGKGQVLGSFPMQSTTPSAWRLSPEAKLIWQEKECDSTRVFKLYLQLYTFLSLSQTATSVICLYNGDGSCIWSILMDRRTKQVML